MLDAFMRGLSSHELYTQWDRLIPITKVSTGLIAGTNSTQGKLYTPLISTLYSILYSSIQTIEDECPLHAFKRAEFA